MGGNCSCFGGSAEGYSSKNECGGIGGAAVANNNNDIQTTAHQRCLTSRDVLERSEIEELMGTSPAHQVTGGDSFGGKLLKKPIHVLNGTTLLSAKEQPNNQNGILSSQISDNKINCLFEEYKDPCEDAISALGIERLCCDLQYKPEDFAILVLAWRLKASQMCRFTKTEFIQGVQELNADSIQSIRVRLEEQIEILKTDGEMFKNLYRFTFRFGLEPGLRTLGLEMAMSLWRLVFTLHPPDILEKWIHFLGENPQIRGIPKDTWNMFLNFTESCDIYAYNDEEAWPSLFDDFVDYETSEQRRRMAEEGEAATTERLAKLPLDTNPSSL